MQRTYNPKNVYYKPDGTGRDEYIFNNNGGLGKRDNVRRRNLS